MRRLIFIAAAVLLAGGGNLALARGGRAGPGGPGAGVGSGHGGPGAGMGVGHGGGTSGHASLSALAHTNGPLSLNRDHGIERAADRMSAEGLKNTNGPMSPNRSKGTARASQRHAQHPLSVAGEQER